MVGVLLNWWGVGHVGLRLGLAAQHNKNLYVTTENIQQEIFTDSGRTYNADRRMSTQAFSFAGQSTSFGRATRRLFGSHRSSWKLPCSCGKAARIAARISLTVAFSESFSFFE